MYEDWELIDMYKRAKHKKAQIKILCHLSDRKEYDIRDMLIRAGFDVAPGKKRIHQRKRRITDWSDAEIDTLISLRRQEKTFTEISAIIGRTYTAVSKKYHSVTACA